MRERERIRRILPDRSKKNTGEVKVDGTRGKNFHRRSLPLLCMRHYYFESRSHAKTVKNREMRIVLEFGDSSATVSSGKEEEEKNDLTSSTDRLSTLGMFRSSKHGGPLFMRRSEI